MASKAISGKRVDLGKKHQSNRFEDKHIKVSRDPEGHYFGFKGFISVQQASDLSVAFRSTQKDDALAALRGVLIDPSEAEELLRQLDEEVAFSASQALFEDLVNEILGLSEESDPNRRAS